MPRQLMQLTVFASGTSETESERSALRRVAEELNKQLEKTHSITLRVRAWRDDLRPGVSAYSQAELNRQLGTEYDIYLGVLGSRFGTPTPQAGSGTEEEFKLALKKLQADSQSVRLLFYFKRAAEDPFTLDVEQLQRVKQFRNALADHGVVYRDFTDTSEFVQQTREHLYNLIIDEWLDGRWTRIDGPGQPPAPLIPRPNGEGAPDEVSEPTAEPPPSQGTIVKDADDELRLGYLEYIQQFHQAVPALVETFATMSQHTTQVTERIRVRTAESESLQGDFSRSKGASGSRAQQEYIERAKQAIDGAADDLNEYAESMSAALSQYRAHSRAMFNNFKFAIQSAKELWTDETKRDNRTALEQMIEAMETTLQHITEFQVTIKRMPDMTARFIRARNQTASVLGELVAEITFSVGEAKEIIAELGVTEAT